MAAPEAEDRPGLPSPPFGPGTPPGMGPLEKRVLDVLWRTKRANSARGVLEELGAAGGPPPAYTTIATVLGHLVEKGLVTRARVSNAWTYEAALSGCEYSAAQMAACLEDTNDRQRCLSNFLGLLRPEDISLLRDLI